MKAGKLSILHSLFGEVRIPEAVFSEATGNKTSQMKYMILPFLSTSSNWRDCYAFCNAISPRQIRNVPASMAAKEIGHLPFLLNP